MTLVEKRKVLLVLKKKSIAGMARKYSMRLPKAQRNLESLRKQFSMCINGDRDYPHLHAFIASELDEPVEQLFGSEATQAAA